MSDEEIAKVNNNSISYISHREWSPVEEDGSQEV
jgi:hypothetical protein